MLPNLFSLFRQKIIKSNPKSKPIISQQPGSIPTLETIPCCSNIVHIAYRGISDDKLYLAYNRTWQEVKYFRPKSLRVYCKDCRRRIY